MLYKKLNVVNFVEYKRRYLFNRRYVFGHFIFGIKTYFLVQTFTIFLYGFFFLLRPSLRNLGYSGGARTATTQKNIISRKLHFDIMPAPVNWLPVVLKILTLDNYLSRGTRLNLNVTPENENMTV